MAFFRKLWPTGLAACVIFGLALVTAQAGTSLVVDVDSGNVLYQDNATVPWFPASLTKLMTTYVALSAVREGRITFDTPLMVSPRAASMPPSKMGFRPGTLVTLDNALKMLMVKSPNDVAVTIAEGISGSVEAFANDMNVYAARLGLHESHFANPNGLPDDRHFSSARDMAIIGRALLREFPEERSLFSIGVLAFGRQLINNHNGLLGRYPGVDGMKTGYTCAAGYNLVASAERNGKRLIVVVMGSPLVSERNDKAAALFDRFFAGNAPSIGTLGSLPDSSITAPHNMRDQICGPNRRNAIAEAEAEDATLASAPADSAGEQHPERAFLLDRAAGQGAPMHPAPSPSLSPVRAAFEPVRVFVGPVAGWTGRVAQAVGTGSKELTPAPVKTIAADAARKPADQESIGDKADGGPVEAPAPAPMALLGAAPLAPAALATKRLVKTAPSLSLRAGATHRDRARARRARAHEAPVPVAKRPAAAAAEVDKPKARAKASARRAVVATPRARPASAKKAPVKKKAVKARARKP